MGSPSGYIETEALSIACLGFVAGTIIFGAVCSKQIVTACVILRAGVGGLFATCRILLVALGVQLV